MPDPIATTTTDPPMTDPATSDRPKTDPATGHPPPTTDTSMDESADEAGAPSAGRPLPRVMAVANQ